MTIAMGWSHVLGSRLPCHLGPLDPVLIGVDSDHPLISIPVPSSGVRREIWLPVFVMILGGKPLGYCSLGRSPIGTAWDARWSRYASLVLRA
jgi:hypothetical protein